MYVVPANRQGSPRTETVTAVGHKWGYLGRRSRFNLATGWIDGGEYSSPGRVWPSEEAYRAYAELIHDWNNFKQTVLLTHSPPTGVGRAEIAKATELLKP